MAGRGTDIRLGAGIAEAGWLHVILTEFHESARIDRQLFGRCGRQGDVGTHEALVSFEDELFQRHASMLTGFLTAAARAGGSLPSGLATLLRYLAQRSAERLNARVRKQNRRNDARLAQMLGFTGDREPLRVVTQSGQRGASRARSPCSDDGATLGSRQRFASPPALTLVPSHYASSFLSSLGMVL